MNFYRDFCQNRLADVEEQLSAASELFQVDDDEKIDAEGALTALARLTANAELAKSMLTTMAAAKVYKIGQTYQVIDAVATEDLADEAEVIAEIGNAGLNGAYAGANPAPIGVGHGYSHPAYPRIISRIPIKHIHRLGPLGMFNGCLFEHEGKSLFSCRTQGFPSRTSLYRPDLDFVFGEPKELSLPESFPYCSIEDVRIFRHNETTMASFTLAGQTEKGWICQMVIGEISEARELVRPRVIVSPTGAHVEKNWVFFSNEGRLFCVYYPAPHVVYEVELKDETAELGNHWEAENWQAAYFMENARGGASPVRIGGEFYHFYHTQHRHGCGTAYQIGLYTFKAKPPWNISRIVKGPLMSLVPSKRPLDVIFVTGSQLRNGRWTLSCGLQDQETVAIAVDFDDVEMLLVKVP